MVMAVSLQTLSEADHRRLAQKEKIKAVYEMLLDIPDEMSLFHEKRVGKDERTFYDDPEMLKWLAVRIKQRLTEANLAIQEAVERMDDGVLDLSRKNLCDLTIKDFHAPIPALRKIILSGNYLRTLPPLCSLKPYLQKVEAVGNLVDIEPIFETFLRENQVSFDLFNVFHAVCLREFDGKEDYVSLLEDIAINADKASVVELAHRVHAHMSAHKPPIIDLAIHPRMDGIGRCGGVKGFIPLDYFTNLESLDLSGCLLESLAPFDWLANLARLKRLNLSNTPISQLPPSLIGKPIEELNLASTRIHEIPLWIESLSSLKILDISDTLVSALPFCMHKLPLLRCNLDGTRVTILPSFNHTIQVLSIKRTHVGQLPNVFASLFKEGRLLIDESNHESLKLQARIYRQFHSPVVATWVFNGEVYKQQIDSIPSTIKTGMVGIKYISVISFLMVWQICDALLLTVPASCQIRSHARSSKFHSFREQNVARTSSLFFMLLLFQFLPLSKRWQDTVAVSRYIGR
jgi:Leucine-rich repeat (LRR) protein